MKHTTLVNQWVSALRQRGLLVNAADTQSLRVSLPDGFPKLYHTLFHGCLFQAFDLRSVRVASNLRSAIHNLTELWEDRTLAQKLTESGFMPFGRPADGSWDRICFDMRAMKKRDDAPVVRVDHEAILSFSRLPKPECVAGGLADLFIDRG